MGAVKITEYDVDYPFLNLDLRITLLYKVICKTILYYNLPIVALKFVLFEKLMLLNNNNLSFIANIAYKQYFFSTNILSWDDASASCKRKGGQLVVIQSAQENDLLDKIIK